MRKLDWKGSVSVVALCFAGACDLQHGPNRHYIDPVDATDSDVAMSDGGEGVDGGDGGIDTDAGSCTCDDPTKPVCTDRGVCVACTEAQMEHCVGDTPVCGPKNICVECTASDPTACAAERSLCNDDAHACVECLERADCQEAKPACTAGHACDKCTEDADCKRFGKVCDEPAGICVACTLDSEAVQCGKKSCDPATKLCTQTERGSVAQCTACVADSECEADHRCIEMFFGAGVTKVSLGGRCMKRLSAGCGAPYSGAPIRRASLSGAPAEDHCGISETRTSCEALLKLFRNTPCPTGQDNDCDAPGALCRKVNGTSNLCTYACSGSAECPDFATCPTSGNDKYCGKN